MLHLVVLHNRLCCAACKQTFNNNQTKANICKYSPTGRADAAACIPPSPHPCHDAPRSKRCVRESSPCRCGIGCAVCTRTSNAAAARACAGDCCVAGTRAPPGASLRIWQNPQRAWYTRSRCVVWSYWCVFSHTMCMYYFHACRFFSVVSGGGSLATHLDLFYESIGLPVVNGWGLTETSPVLACRRNTPDGNARGTVGM